MRRALLTTPPRRRAVRMAGAWMTCLLALALCPGLASALTIGSFETSRTGADGTPSTQAGAHPNLTASFTFGESEEPETARDVRVGLPKGFFISPDAVPKCSAANFATFECSSSAQVGLITLRADHEGDPSRLLGTAPVYALGPAPGEIARYGFIAPVVNLPVEIPVTVRSASDYGLDMTFVNLPQLAPLTGAKLTLWGAPADPMHDAQRFGSGAPGAPAGCPGVEGTSCIVGPSPVGIPIRPLLHNPTACSGPLTSTLDVDTHEHPSDFLTSAFTDSVGTSDCGISAFSPMSSIALTTAQTRSPSGLNLELAVNDGGFHNPSGVAQSQIESVSVALPAGLRINSSAAAALSTCTDAQFAKGSAAPSACPPDSEVGLLSIAIAGLPSPLEGTAYLGTPEPAGTYRLLLAASGSGIDAKLVGLLQPETPSKPVTIALPRLPQLPLEELELALAADAELLVTPVECGIHEAKATFTPWSSPGAPAFLTTSNIPLTSTGPGGGPCPGPATAVELSLSPASIRADGSSTSLATATMTDTDGIGVPGEEVVFISTDADQEIGAVTDNEDGIYNARITSSTTVGAATITATDTGAGVFAIATLTQLAPSPPQSDPILPLPPVAITSTPPSLTIARKPPRRANDRTPTFRFDSTTAGSSFSCSLDSKPFRPCASPKTLPKLSFGTHTFSIRTTDPAGVTSTPIACKFTVLRPHA